MKKSTVSNPVLSAEKNVGSKRLQDLKNAIENAKPSICIERAVHLTEYFKVRANRKKPMVIQKAEALAYVLKHKTIRIYPAELIVGTTTSKRVAGPIYPELHGLPMLEDLFHFGKRKVNPLQITKKEKKQLLSKVAPFWVNKFLGFKSLSTWELFGFVKDQLNPKFYLINETGGIGHLVPDHETLLKKGLHGIKLEAEEKCKLQRADTEEGHFYQAVIIICEGLSNLAMRLAQEARDMAERTADYDRKKELLGIAENLKQVPHYPARTFHEALQSVWLLHSVIVIEGLDNGISFGRSDQYLYPYFLRDREKGKLNAAQAKELLGCFAIKSAEIIPVFSEKITDCHGGFLSGQAMTIGGMDKNGKDVTNELSYILLELMDEVRLRQPNFHARVHPGSPSNYMDKIVSNLCKGVNSPAIFNDEVIIKSLEACGFSKDDAKEYATLGCVELSAPGKTFGSTDAALVNIPICLEMALNQGRLFGKRRLKGFATPHPDSFSSIEDLKTAFRVQLQFMIDRMVKVLAKIEIGNKDFHPTPLTSAFTQGCLEKGMDVTAGGAIYNFSGVQGVGVSDVGDSLYAIWNLVFEEKKYRLSELVEALKKNFKGADKLHQELLNAGKFGNDDPNVDRYSQWVANTFYDVLEGKVNTRGGKFVGGFYSTTTHYSFGKQTGATANGRKKSKPFSSGISPMNGQDKKGPTALFNSITAIDFVPAHNGANVNAKFDTATLKGPHGQMILKSLLLTYLKKGGMQIQLNVFDADMLKDAKEHPDKYPWLLVRVSGYSAYFNDLSPAMKDEIISRSTLGI